MQAGWRTSRRMLWAALIGAACLVGPVTVGGAAPLLGVNLDLAELPAEQRDSRVEALAEAGVASVRMPVDWNRVEPEEGEYEWAVYDEAVDAARRAGLEVVFVLGPCAEWAVSPERGVPPGERVHSVPASIEVWEEYVQRAVEHFRGRVRFWQVRRQPTARNFRGARAEYLRLLESAAKAARQADPAARLIVPEGGTLDIAAVDRLLHSDAADSFDVLGVYLPGPQARLLLPWAVLSNEVLGHDSAAHGRPAWVLGGEEGMSRDAWTARYLLAWAFGAERCYLPPDAVRGDWARELRALRYVGFITPSPGVFALVFQAPGGYAVAAWADHELSMPIERICPVLDEMVAREAAALGGAPGGAVVGDAEPLTLRLGPRPVLVRGLAPEESLVAGAPARDAVLASDGRMDMGGLPLVYADYSLPERPEYGLRNRQLREMPGGAVVEEARSGRACVGTKMWFGLAEEEYDEPWLFFDVDDSWLYFARGRTRVAITVICEAAFRGEEMLGFSIIYDATRGYRFTKWQWVDAGYGWRRYRIVLDDVSFANRDGYDFRINAKGSKQDLWVGAVIVEKLPPEPAPEPQPAD